MVFLSVNCSAMVFESLVSDLLNRFIGDYVENLDKSQLKIGIWGGECRMLQLPAGHKISRGLIMSVKSCKVCVSDLSV